MKCEKGKTKKMKEYFSNIEKLVRTEKIYFLRLKKLQSTHKLNEKTCNKTFLWHFRKPQIKRKS